MCVTLLGAEAADAHDTFTASIPWTGAYHTWAWIRLLANVYDYTPRVYAAWSQAGELRGVLALCAIPSPFGGRRLVGLPFSHHVPPACLDGEALLALCQEAFAAARREGFSSLRLRADAPELAACGLSTHGENLVSRLNLQTSIETLWKGLHGPIRRNVKKAREHGLVIEETSAPESWASFYTMMVATRRRQGSPPYPHRLFTALSTFPHARLFLASRQGQTLSGLVLLCRGTQALYAYGASVDDRELLRFRPNDLLFWSAIEELSVGGFKELDFGSTPIGHDSLLRFKEQWGAASQRLVDRIWPAEAAGFDRLGHATRLAGAVIRHCPSSLLARLGDHLFKYLG